jgi:hypothetical protein
MDAAPIRRNDKRGVVLVDLDEGVEVATVECVLASSEIGCPFEGAGG